MEYDRIKYQPVLRSSICTGEQIVGFKDRKSGHFIEVQLIQSSKDLKHFLKTYHLREDDLKKEW
ncbi:MAG: aspartate dehydrogenase [Lachnospirales bacterium]